MPGLLLHVNTAMTCTHGALAAVQPAQTRVLVSGMPVATMTGPITVIGCPFQIPVGAGTKPSPCVTIKWAMPAARVMVMGQPAAVAPGPGTAPGICQSPEQIPQGPPVIIAMQTRVIGT